MGDARRAGAQQGRGFGVRHDDPLAYIHQAVCHQLRHAGEDIENGDGLVVDFDYDEEIEVDYLTDNHMSPVMSERIVTLELTYLLPE
jgi:hypothetical protein